MVVPVLEQLPMHDPLVSGQASSMDELLNRCSEQVDNHTAFEAARAFALTMDGLFERQLCRWAHTHGKKASSMETALPTCAGIASFDLATAGLVDDLKELHLVANVVRHGEGRSCKELQVLAPQLWDEEASDYHDLAPGAAPASDLLRISGEDLSRYARAIIRFWGHADPLPVAALNPP
ncbi:hypothetical protein FPZ54_14060 [Sphingomonas suaedae]|uniref:Uncharacterized protein n=1 Tax=Sphingomonas suaedae TaxID=2599297 RepID=A0A518RLH6_9SPHN|nr:hypothetical protein FPZ54_14060 [Sphingomonas suaedae]